MKIKFGCIYKRRWGLIPNDQSYGYYVPVHLVIDGKDNYKMVDTHHLEIPVTSTLRTIEDRVEFLKNMNNGSCARAAYYAPYNFYYKNEYIIESPELDDNEWEMFVDLTECDMVSDSDLDDYNPKEIYDHVPLYNEEAFRWDTNECGRNYKKKTTKRDPNFIAYKNINRLSNKLDASWNCSSASWNYNELKKLDLNSLNDDVAKSTKAWMEKYEAYEKFKNDLNKKFIEIDKKYN